jgi:hypothetical protein
MTSRQVAIFESLAGDTLSEFGYEVAGTRLRLRDRVQMSAMWLSFQGRRMRWQLQRRSGKFKRRSGVPSETKA